MPLVWSMWNRLPLAVFLAGLTACAPGIHSTSNSTAPPDVAQLWQAPADLELRDLYYGVGGQALVPPTDAPFEVVAVDTTGYSRGYDVRDARGMKWSVKLGKEVEPEVVVSRLFWAIGYYEPPTYYVPQWTASGKGPQGPSRFRPTIEGEKVLGDWSWYENPFVDTQAYRALLVANLLVNNWDLKTTNNKIYKIDHPDNDIERRYVVRDLGASFGRSTSPIVYQWLHWRMANGTKASIDDFESAGFIRRQHGEHIEFDYAGVDGALFRRITPADVRFTCELFSRLTDKQWQDAFRAAQYPPEVSARYIRKLKEKIAQGLKAAS